MMNMERLDIDDYAMDIALFEEYVPVSSFLSEKEKQDVVNSLLEELKHIIDKFEYFNAEKQHDKRRLLHAALNVLEPAFLRNDSIKKLDSLLQTELYEKAIINGSEIAQPGKLNVHGTKVMLFQGDITTIQIDAIVNAANNQLLGCFQPLHACIDNAIHSKAGVQLRDDCFKIMKKQKIPEPTGTAKVTRAYNLPSKFVIHTVGPIVQGNLTSQHKEDLKKSYLSCLDICTSIAQIKSIAFCCMSTGVFGYPPEEAAKTAFKTVFDWLKKNLGELDYVIFNVFTDQDRLIYESLIEKYDI